MTTATTTLPLTQTQARIKEIQREIYLTNTKITTRNQEIKEFEEAINLIESNAKYLPQPGELAPFDQLQNLLAEQQSQAEREAKLATARQALENCRDALQSSNADLDNYNKYLSYLQSEDEWETQFAPYAEEYRDSFPIKTALQVRQQQIDELTKDIANKKEILRQATEWLKAPREAKPRYFVPAPLNQASTALDYLPKAIPTLETQLKALQETPIVESPDYQRGFREYVKGRVTIKKSLASLLKAQAAYTDSVVGLREALKEIPPGTIDINPQELGLRKTLTVDEHNVIRHA